MIKAGRLRNRITLQRNHPQKNSLGEPTPVWRDYATIDAEVIPLVGKEFYSAQQINTQLTTKIRIRWLPGVKAGDQVAFAGDQVDVNNRTLLIATPPININERNTELILMCRELA